MTQVRALLEKISKTQFSRPRPRPRNGPQIRGRGRWGCGRRPRWVYPCPSVVELISGPAFQALGSNARRINLGLRSPDSLQPRLSHCGPSALKTGAVKTPLPAPPKSDHRYGRPGRRGNTFCVLCTAIHQNPCVPRRFAGARLGLEGQSQQNKPDGNGQGNERQGNGTSASQFSFLRSFPCLHLRGVGLRLRRAVSIRVHPWLECRFKV
jgi:hypothetical protein